ncbi:MAG: hypothetical protein ACI8QZ_002024 [Chlamydiales bacterium]|jgi:hypothetical protein
MSSNDDRRAAQDGAHGRDPERTLEERLLHGLLSKAGGGEQAADDDEWSELCDGAEARQVLPELEGFLSTCKAALVPERAQGADGRLVRRILDRTTGAADADVARASTDLSWRGDLRLVRGFLAARWKASFVLRVAAASLMLHLAALPLLAYFGLTSSSPDFTLTFIPRFVSDYGDSQEPEHEVAAEEMDEFPEVRDLPHQDELGIQNALQWARFHLGNGEFPGAVGSLDERDGIAGVGRALEQRGSYLRSGSPGTGPGGASWALAHRDPVVRVIAVEHLLDRYVLERDLPAGLGAGLRDLGNGAGAPVRALELRTLLRARSYGLLDSALVGRLEGFLEALPEVLGAWDPLAPGAPVDRAHVHALGQALGTSLGTEPTVAIWLRWRE